MIIATVGHVDHGKTTLVRALTGVDTDKLPEEKARGMSIDLGFAYRHGADGRLIGFVDVPGHERFVRNMLAGVCGIDLALIVVAADDGVMPQTREHVAILDLLGVAHGAVVVTKADRVDARRIEQVLDEVREILAGTALVGVPAFRTAARSGVGIATLVRFLDAQLPQAFARGPCAGPARLAIDRAFTVVGSGTVITGTVFDGQVAVGDEIVVSPSGQPARVRRIRVHDADVERVIAGQRCALNLAGIGLEHVERGHWVLSAGLHQPTRLLDVKLRVLADVPGALNGRAPLQLHLGTTSVAARAIPSPQGSASPGTTSFAKLRLDAPIAALRGDRFVLRDPSTRRTVGGGVVLDPFPSTDRASASQRAARLRALDQPTSRGVLHALAGVDPGFIDLAWFTTAFRLAPEQARDIVHQAGLVVLGTDAVIAVTPGRLDQLGGDTTALLAQHHREQPQQVGMARDGIARAVVPGLPAKCFDALLDSLVKQDLLRVEGNRVRLPEHQPTLGPVEQTLWHRVHPKIYRGGFAPPRVGDLARRLDVDEAALLRLLHRKVSHGELLKVGEDRFVLRETAARLAEVASRVARAQPDGRFSAAQFRDAIGTGRGLAIDFLECLDRQRFTVRSGGFRRLSPSKAGITTNDDATAERRRRHWRHRHRFNATPAPSSARRGRITVDASFMNVGSGS